MIKTCEECNEELDVTFRKRINSILRNYDHYLFTRIIEEIKKAKIFSDSFGSKEKQLKEKQKNIIAKKQEVVQSKWPNDTIFSEWVTKYKSYEARTQVGLDVEEENKHEAFATLLEDN